MTSPRPQPARQAARSPATQYKAQAARLAFWKQPDLAGRIKKAIEDHKAGKSVPFRDPDAD